MPVKTEAVEGKEDEEKKIDKNSVRIKLFNAKFQQRKNEENTRKDSKTIAMAGQGIVAGTKMQ